MSSTLLQAQLPELRADVELIRGYLARAVAELPPGVQTSPTVERLRVELRQKETAVATLEAGGSDDDVRAAHVAATRDTDWLWFNPEGVHYRDDVSYSEGAEDLLETPAPAAVAAPALPLALTGAPVEASWGSSPLLLVVAAAGLLLLLLVVRR